MTAANPAAQTSAVIVALPRDPEVLTVEGGDTADEMHCTLWFLGRINEHGYDREVLRDTVGRVAASVGPVEVSVIGVGRLGALEVPATVLKLSEGLVGIRAMIDNTTEMPPERFPVWIPHVTQGYGTEETPEMIGTVITFDRLALWWAGEKEEFLLNGN